MNRKDKIEQAYEEKEKLYRKYEVARQKYNDLKIQEYKDKWLGQFITIDDEPNSEQYWKHQTYLFVTNIWYSSNDNIMYVEGAGFSGLYTEYRDDTYFSWTQFLQQRIPYDWIENKNMIKVDLIDKETYDKAFYELIDQMKKEHQEYEYTIDVDDPNEEDDGPHEVPCPD